MAKKKKTNPRRKPVTEADVDKAMKIAQKQFEQVVEEIKNEAFSKTTRRVLVVALAVLHDKYGWGKVRMNRYFDYLNDMSEAVVQGYVSIDDLEEMLAKECDVVLLDD